LTTAVLFTPGEAEVVGVATFNDIFELSFIGFSSVSC
jgi:hypothetical protein